MSVDYRYLIADCSTGKAVCELPIYNARFTRVLSGVGEFTGSIPLDHPKATRANLNGDREVTVLRNSTPIWNGPKINLNPRVEGSGPYYVDITAREASYYLFRRVDSAGRAFAATTDLFDLVRTLVTYATGKTGGSLYNFAVSPSSATAGQTLGKLWRYAGSKLYVIGQIIQDLGADPSNGFDWRMDYTTGSTRQSVTRTLTLGAPSLGSTKSQVLTRHLLSAYGEVEDREKSSNSVYVRGGNGQFSNQTNATSLTTDILLESVYDRPDLTNSTQLVSWAKEFRRLAQPPVKTYSFSYIPDGPQIPSTAVAVPALPYGWANLGDKVTLNIDWPDILSINDSRRIVVEETIPPQDGTPEVVNCTTNLPLDRLGT